MDGVPKTVTLETIPVTFFADVSRVDLAYIRQDCDDYRRQESDRGEAECAEASSGANLDAMFRKTCYGTHLVTQRVL